MPKFLAISPEKLVSFMSKATNTEKDAHLCVLVVCFQELNRMPRKEGHDVYLLDRAKDKVKYRNSGNFALLIFVHLIFVIIYYLQFQEALKIRSKNLLLSNFRVFNFHGFLQLQKFAELQ